MKILIADETIEISISDLTQEIYNEAIAMRQNFTEDELETDLNDSGSGIDCRLRVFNGSYQLITGDSQYDTDHRGSWSVGFIPYDCDRNEAQNIAEDLLNNIE